MQVLGLAHYLAGRIAEAIPFLEQTRAGLPDNAELAYVLGMAYIQTAPAGQGARGLGARLPRRARRPRPRTWSPRR